MAFTKLLSLVEIFNEKIFRVPDFQRGYSWDEPQLEDFWEDIKILQPDRHHYTGQITVELIEKKDVLSQDKWHDDLWLIKSGVNAYYLIDGQQRLITAIILINEILKIFPENGGINFQSKEDWIKKFLYKEFGSEYKSFIFGYEKDNPSDEFFKTNILGQKSSSSDKVPSRTLYTSNLLYAKKYFAKKIRKLSEDEIEIIFKKIVNQFKFGFYEIDDELDVYVTFETMNNRGKPLSNLELLKNRLIYLSTILPYSDESNYTQNRLRKDINESWKTIYEYLGKNKDNPLDDDNFLKDHWIIYFKYDRREAGAYSKFLLNKYFTTKNISKTSAKSKIGFQEIKDYIDSLSEAVKVWFYIFNPSMSEYSAEIQAWIQKLNRLGFGAFVPLLMAVLIKENNHNKIVDFLRAAERFNFLVFRIAQRQSNTKNNHFFRLANKYYKNQETISKVIEDLQWETDGEDEDDYYGWFGLDRFQDHIKELYQKAEGFYSWNGIRYFLYEYELYLQYNADGDMKISWSDFFRRKKEDTIEHIYPRKPTHKTWKENFAGLKRKQKKQLLHSLGNLLLLAKSKNSELQNHRFGFKKKHKNKKGNHVGYFNGSYSEIDVAQYHKWSPKEIIEQGIRMLDFMEDRWRIDFEEWEISKNELLNIEAS